jgi:hypothetical protein
MTKRQEMLSTLHNPQLLIPTPRKHFNLPLSVSNRIHHIISPMQPQNRTLNIRQSRMQTISIPKIDSSHSSSFPAFVTNVVIGDFVAPEVADGGGAVFAETDVDEEVGEGVAWAE